MKLLADVNVPKHMLVRLRADGHEVAAVVDINRRLSDRAILQLSLTEDAVIITQDRDYWQLVMVEQRPCMGVIWVRLARMPHDQRVERLAATLQEPPETFRQWFTVIYPNRVEHYPMTAPSGP